MSVNDVLIRLTFKNTSAHAVSPKKFVSLKQQPAWVRYNPVNYIGGGALYFYQNVISEQIGASCCYETSCSAYCKKAIGKFGLVKGVLVGLHQFNNCFSGVEADYPGYLLNTLGKIENTNSF